MPNHYNPPAFNPEDPRYQREAQRARSKQSMGPKRLGRVVQGEIAGKHAGYQLGRHLDFARMAQSKLSSQLAHKHRMAGLAHSGRLTGLAEDQVASQRAQFLPSMLLGLGGIGLSGYLGYKRDKATKESARKSLVRKNEVDQYIEAQRSGIPLRYLYGPGGR